MRSYRGKRRKRRIDVENILLCAILLLTATPAVFGFLSAAAVYAPAPAESLEDAGTPAPSVGADPEPTDSPTAEPSDSPTAEPTDSPTAEPSASPTAEPTDSPTVEPTDSPTAEPSASPTAEPSVSPTTKPSDSPSPEPVQTPEFPPYSFGDFLEESAPAADDAYFDRAVFLGDSRTEGLQLYSGLSHGDFFWKRGMTVFRVDSKDWTFNVGGEKLTMIEALRKKRYDSVYIMIGVNELGYPVSSYERSLGAFIDKVIAAQPDAVIYLQTLPPVNDRAAQDSGLGSYVNNKNVSAFNEVIIRTAAKKQVVLLNTAEVYRGEDGQLPANMTSDGCHFKYGGYSIWADYLRCHIMDPARYHYYRGTAGTAGAVD